MAVVIPFAPRRREAAQSSAEGSPQRGTILFFTGVRYERHLEAMPPARPERPLSRPAGRTRKIRKRAGLPV